MRPQSVWKTGDPAMKTAYLKTTRIVTLAADLYREMALSALRLLPTRRTA